MTLYRSIALWFGMIAAGVILLLTLCPRILTGTYADITVTKITQFVPGQYTLECTYVSSVGTRVSSAFYDGNKSMGGGSGASYGVFGWPEKGTTGLMFSLDPESRSKHAMSSPRPDRLLVKEGQTITLHAGQRLYFFDFITADGVRHYGYIEVESSGSRR